MSSSSESQPQSSIYTPLDKTTRSIRLLRFEEPPPSSASDLYFTLRTHKLPTSDESRQDGGRRTRFIALSYTWEENGPEDSGEKAESSVEKPQTSIIVNGKHFPILKNLHALLQALRTKIKQANRLNPNDTKNFFSLLPGSFSRFLRNCPYFWADAICINQQSEEEKAHQVNMMGDIYLRAECVVAWLGPANNESNLAMSLFHKTDLESSKAHKLDALLVLLNRSYWQRMWIVQEFALARAPILLCGQFAVSLADERHGWERIRMILNWPPAEGTAAFPVFLSRLEFDEIPTFYDFHCMVYKLRKQKCRLVQDRVFALLALYSKKAPTWEHDLPRITANYDITPERLFYRVLAECSFACNSQGAVSEMQEVLNVPNCTVETEDDACIFIGDVTGFNDADIEDEEVWESLNTKGIAELIKEGIIRDWRVEEVRGHIEKLTGLTAKEMEKDPEGTYLEVLGRLYNYNTGNRSLGRKDVAEYWERFINVVKCALGIQQLEFSGSVLVE